LPSEPLAHRVHTARSSARARYWLASRLFHACARGRADDTYTRLLGQLAWVDVLVLDDWGLAPLQDVERRDLLEILEDRAGIRSKAPHDERRTGSSTPNRPRARVASLRSR
jgi:hypothetical protein